MTDEDRRVPTKKWRQLPARVDKSQHVEMVERDPQVEEIDVTNYGNELIRFDHA